MVAPHSLFVNGYWHHCMERNWWTIRRNDWYKWYGLSKVSRVILVTGITMTCSISDMCILMESSKYLLIIDNIIGVATNWSDEGTMGYYKFSQYTIYRLLERKSYHYREWKLNGDYYASPTKISSRKTLFCFPKDPAFRRRCVQNMHLENFVVKDHSRLCEKHFEEDQFEVSPKVIESLGLKGKKKLKLKIDAVPTIFDRGSPKSSSQVLGKKSFKRKKMSSLETKFQSKFDYLCGSPKRLSPKKRYGAYTKRRRLEVNRLKLVSCQCE